MTSKEKRDALNQALAIAKEYSGSSSETYSPAEIIKETYETILDILSKIEEDKD